MLDEFMGAFVAELIDHGIDLEPANALADIVALQITRGNFEMTALMRRVCVRLGIRPATHLGVIAYTRAMPLESEPT